MINRIVVTALVVAAGALAFASAAYQEELLPEVELPAPQLLAATAETPSLLSVSAYAVFDPQDGRILLAHNADDVVPIASITKLFSAMVIRDLFDLDTTTSLEWSDLNAVGTAGRLQFGQTYTFRELLFPLLLSSSNNAALTFERRARAMGTSLPEEMSDLAVRAGFPAVRFADASGLSSSNQASARDLAGLVAATRERYAYIYSIASLRSYVGPYLAWRNNSPFITDSNYVTGKHGFTHASGRTALVIFKEDIGGIKTELGYVILGSVDLEADMVHLRAKARELVSWQ